MKESTNLDLVCSPCIIRAWEGQFEMINSLSLPDSGPTEMRSKNKHVSPLYRGQDQTFQTFTVSISHDVL